MTAQRTDKLLWNNEKYTIFDSEQGKLLFKYFEQTDQYKKQKNKCSNNSALWRGHLEYYRIIDEMLYGYKCGNGNHDIYRINEASYEPVNYTGSIVIGTTSIMDGSFLQSYLFSERAYELYFCEGKLNEVIDLKEAINFHKSYKNSLFYTQNSDVREINGKYLEPMAYHFLKYKYDPFHSYCWRYNGNSFYKHITDVEREKQRCIYEEHFQELVELMTSFKNE